MKRASRKDLYATLGVAQDADEDDIRKAYKKMALKYHPDRHASKVGERDRDVLYYFDPFKVVLHV
jgi:DnaJ-class molecular chaperone